MLGRGAFSCAERGLVLMVFSTGDYVMNVVQ